MPLQEAAPSHKHLPGCVGLELHCGSVHLWARCRCSPGQLPQGARMRAAGKNKLLDEMLAYPAQLYRLDILHGKFGTLFGKPVTTTT